MENQSDLKQILESIRAFTQSPEYAQLQKAVTIYQDNMMELAKAVQPFQAPLQQLAVEICKGLAQLIEELRKQPEVDIEPLEELQEAVEGNKPFNFIEYIKGLSVAQTVVLLDSIKFYIDYVPQEYKMLFVLLHSIILAILLSNKDKGNSQE